MLVPLMNATFMTRLTPKPLRKTNRKPSAGTALLAVLLGLAGCMTPGPNHVYLAPASGESATILDLAEGQPEVEVPAWLAPADRVLGVAYDPFTDHLFLRLAPGNQVRVVDRPARSIKREFEVAGLPATGGGDLAIRSRDRHLFFGHPTEPVIVESTLYGEFVRRIPLEGMSAPPAGLAYDQRSNQLLTLAGGDLTTVSVYDLDGHRLRGIGLSRNVRLGALAYDSVAAELYVLMADTSAIGVFDLQGELRRQIPVPSAPHRPFLDVGPRSFLRVFSAGICRVIMRARALDRLRP